MGETKSSVLEDGEPIRFTVLHCECGGFLSARRALVTIQGDGEVKVRPMACKRCGQTREPVWEIE